MNYAVEIKQRLDTIQVFEYYGFKPNRAGFVCCPFHSEKTASMKIYEGDKGYHCFGCGASGDVIKFVQQYFGVGFKDAIQKLNDDFMLGLPISERITKQKRLEMSHQAFERNKVIKEQEEKEKAVKDEYFEALGEYRRLEKQKIDYAPKNHFETLHPLFIEALQRLTHASERLTEAEMRLHDAN